MERHERQSAGRQDPPHLLKNRTELRGREMHDGIKRYDPRKAGVREIGMRHVVDAEIDAGMEAPRHLDHAWREGGADRLPALLVQVPGDVAVTAAEFGHEPSPARLFGKTIQ